MIDWTETARRALDEYCARARAVLAGTGADAEEVADDIRRHVDEEVAAAGLKIVTETDVRRILARFGEPGSPLEKKASDKPITAPAPEAGKDKKRPGFILLILGVLLPLGTLIFELVTGASAGVLFDPVPTWFHTVAILLVPVANFLIWRAARSANVRHAKLLGWLNGAALGVCIYYCILYLPFTPIASIGVIYFGVGLIPLAPYLALISTQLLRRAYVRQFDAPVPGLWKGLAISL